MISEKLDALKGLKKGDVYKTPAIEDRPVSVGKGKATYVPKMGEVSAEDRIRGSSDVPISEYGREETKEVAAKITKAGGVDRFIHASNLKRCIETAEIIAEQTGATVMLSPSLQPWHLGKFEGQPTHKVLPKIEEYISNKPDEAVPGRAKESTQDGESFNAFKTRFLLYVKEHMTEGKAEPDERELFITHFRNIKVLQAWIKAGMNNDLTVDTAEMLRKDGEPATVYRFAPGAKGKWEMTEETFSGKKLPGGIYLMRHGHTAWNGENRPVGANAKDGE